MCGKRDENEEYAHMGFEIKTNKLLFIEGRGVTAKVRREIEKNGVKVSDEKIKIDDVEPRRDIRVRLGFNEETGEVIIREFLVTDVRTD